MQTCGLFCVGPYPTVYCKENYNGNYNCSCTQYIHVEDTCEQLISAGVGGYPDPDITWWVGDTMATNGNQALLTILDNGSVSVM